MGDLFLTLEGAAVAVGAAVVLRRAWLVPAPGPARAGLIVGGWAMAAFAVALLAAAIGFDGGPVVAACVLSVAAYGLVALGMDVRKAKAARAPAAAAAEPLNPQARPMRWARATARCGTAVVLAATAAFALAVAWSLHGPGSATDRVVSAAYGLPVAWGAAITWALSDERLARAAAGLAVLTVIGAAAALTPGAGG